MPGGIGRVSEAVQTLSAGRARVFSDGVDASEIFFHLDARNVYLDRRAGLLYFVDTPTGDISRILRAVLCTSGGIPQVEQLHLDSHGLFNAARRVALSAAQAATALIALRLVGVNHVAGLAD